MPQKMLPEPILVQRRADGWGVYRVTFDEGGRRVHRLIAIRRSEQDAEREALRVMGVENDIDSCPSRVPMDRRSAS